MLEEIVKVAEFMQRMSIPMDVQLCSHPGARSEAALSDVIKVLTFQATVAKRAAEHANSIQRRDYRIERMALLTEELAELATALNECDRVGIADALADILYVTLGTALTYGIPLDTVFNAVHSSNMTKQPRGEDDALAKNVKSGTYQEPNIAGVLRTANLFMHIVRGRLAGKPANFAVRDDQDAGED